MEILGSEDSWIVIWSQPKTMIDNPKKLVANAKHLNKINCRGAFPRRIIMFQGNLLVTLPII